MKPSYGKCNDRVNIIIRSIMIWGPESPSAYPESGSSWQRAPGPAPTPATCWGQKYPWPEGQLLPRPTHALGWETDGHWRGLVIPGDPGCIQLLPTWHRPLAGAHSVSVLSGRDLCLCQIMPAGQPGTKWPECSQVTGSLWRRVSQPGLASWAVCHSAKAEKPLAAHRPWPSSLPMAPMNRLAANVYLAPPLCQELVAHR